MKWVTVTFVTVIMLSVQLQASEPITTAAAVRELLPSEASEQRPVKLTGIVTYYRSDALPDFVLQDATGGVHVSQKAAPNGPGITVVPGDEVEIEGVTDAAAYAPRVAAMRVKKISRSALPIPMQATVEDLQAGYHEGQLIEVKAVAREAYLDSSIEPPRLVLRLGTPWGSIDAMIVRFQTEDVTRYADATLRLRGIPLRQQNRRTEPYRWIIFTHSVDDIVVIDPPREPFSVPLTAINQLLVAGPQQSQRRKKVRGVVTYVDDVLVIQDNEYGISVHPREKKELNGIKLGDKVEVAAFARMGMYNPVLEEAYVRVVEHVEMPTAEPIDLKVIKGRELAERDWRRITVVGTVLDITMQKGNRYGFNLRVDHKTIPVIFSKEMEMPSYLVRDMRLQITGVCDLAPGAGVLLLANRPTTFALLVARTEDLVVLQAPPWWNRDRLLYVAIAVGIGLLLTISWALTLRYRVEIRSRQLNDEMRARADVEVAFSAISTERKRLAAELHDSLEQNLTGVALQLEATVMSLTDKPLSLITAQNILAQSRAEVRRAVWDLNTDANEECDLLARMRTLIQHLQLGQTAVITLHDEGIPRSINGLTTHHMTRIVQEAVHNALRHGRATEITIKIHFLTTELLLQVIDNGCGFDLALVEGPPTGHFGLQSLRERARKIGGIMVVTSSPGAGTIISLTISGEK